MSVSIDTAAIAATAVDLRALADQLRQCDDLFAIVQRAGKDEVLGETRHLGESETDKRLREVADRWRVELELVGDDLRNLADDLAAFVEHITYLDDSFQSRIGG